MKRIRIVGLCLAAIFAMSAVAAASAAAAEPEYSSCGKTVKVEKKYSGMYTSKLCSPAALSATNEGEYERVAPTKLPAKLKSTSGVTYIYLSSRETKTVTEIVKCMKDKDEGHIINKREADLKITFEECEADSGVLTGAVCGTPGAKKENDIVTETLVSKLVWLNEAETEIGIAIAPEAGKPIEKVLCGGIETAELLGSMVGKVSPVEEATKTDTLSFTASPTTGVQEYVGYWEGATFQEDALYSELSGADNYTDVQTGQTSVDTQKGGDYVIGG
jgi:hypothetical protein